MEKVLFAFLMLCVIVKASHKSLRILDYSYLSSKNITCDIDLDKLRYAITEQSQCQGPRDVLVPIESRASYENIQPSSIWVKRCVGLCDYSAPGAACTPIDTKIRQIPIRIANVLTGREGCALYPVEEPTSCGCCRPGEDCRSARAFNPQELEYEVKQV